MGEEREKGGAPQQGKSTPKREEASTFYQRKGTEKGKEAKENRGRKGSTPCKGRSAARMEEELDGRAKKEGRRALWKRRPGRGAIIRDRVDDRRDSSVILDLQVWRERVSCRRQPGVRSDLFLEVERIKLVWMQRENRGEGSAVQRDKSAAKRRMVRRTGKYSKKGG